METPGPAKAAQERQRRPSSHQCTSLIACESASLDKVVLFDDPVRLLEKLLEVSRDPVDRVRIMLIDDDLAVGPAVVWTRSYMTQVEKPLNSANGSHLG